MKKKQIVAALILLPISFWGYRMAKYLLTDKDNEIDLMARTLYGEARGEGDQGMQAVANVIMNRVNAGKWYGKTVEEVVLKPKQFSCWNESDPNREKIVQVTASNPTFLRALAISKGAYEGTLDDITRGATHYHYYQITPIWADKMEPTVRIGNHIFYKEV